MIEAIGGLIALFIGWKFLKTGSSPTKTKYGKVIPKSYSSIVNYYGEYAVSELRRYKNKMPYQLVFGIMYVESAGDPNAVGDNGTSIGLFQMTRGAVATAHNFSPWVTDDWSEMKDWKKNIQAGIAYIQYNYDQLQDENEAVLAHRWGLTNMLNRNFTESKAKDYLSRVMKHGKEIFTLLKQQDYY